MRGTGDHCWPTTYRGVCIHVYPSQEGNYLFNNTLNTFLSMVIWRQIYGKGPRIYVYPSQEGNYLFNNALNTFYLWLYGVRLMVKDHSDSEKGNLLLPHGLIVPISSKGSFICVIPQTG